MLVGAPGSFNLFDFSYLFLSFRAGVTLRYIITFIDYISGDKTVSALPFIVLSLI